MKNIEKLFVFRHNTIEDTINAIQRGGVGMALLVDEAHRLISTISDGDIRRAILNKVSLDANVEKLSQFRSQVSPKPTVVREGTSHDEILKIMREKVLRHIPVLDANDKVVELVWISELIEEEEFRVPVSAIVMAGGKGDRLRPLTDDTPKPMLPLEDRPLMEKTIEQLRRAGIKKVDIAIHYKAEVITKHFGNGDAFGVDIDYINEDQPLGTAGALGLTDVPDGPTLVVNGDILTRLDFRAMYDFHHLHKAVMTIAVRKCEFEVPYGVVEIDDIKAKNIFEKPIQTFIINAGIYLLEPAAYRYIPKGRHFDMTNLIDCLIKANHMVICFPIQEYWLDIGHPENYQQAKRDTKAGRV